MLSELQQYFDVIIIGGGPAGLSAGIVASNKGLKAAVFEGGTYGGLLSTIYPKKKVHNYPGTPRIRADHLVSEWVRQAADHGVYFIKERVTRIYENLQVETSEGTIYKAKSVIIATGMKPDELGIPGESKLSKKDRGVYPYVIDPSIFLDKRVLVVGGGDTAVDAVIDLSNVAKKIFLAHRRDEFRASETNLKLIEQEETVEILTNQTITEIIGKLEVEGAVLEDVNTGEKKELAVDKIILAVGLKPNTDIFEDLGLEFQGKFLVTDELQRTNIEGIFAAGDIVSPYQLATVAAAQGALAAHGAYLFIRDPYWKQEHLIQKQEIKPQII
ncbi:MAG: FAD-dependent oxidoreductase [Candidatus Heimdallarchaeota archaeon]|nr:MAG: FAD-dependent oxidoreductase [Candidatus Heimdallarchaeota archaeon]